MIEFACPHCQKTLKTTDDKAGARAACPGCGELVLVPTLAGSTGAGSTSPAGEQAPVEQPGNEAMADLSAPAPFPQPGSAADDTKACPMCGETIKRAATRCRYCGEELGVPGGYVLQSTQIAAGEVVDYAWRIFKSQMGLCMGVVALFIILQYAGNFTVQFGVMGLARQNNLPEPMVMGFVMMVNYLWNLFLTLGITAFVIKIARGVPVGVGELFSGGRLLLVGIASAVLMSVIVMLGLVALIIPGIYLALSLSPVFFVLVDQNVGPIEALKRSWSITRGNVLAILVLGFLSMGLCWLGIMLLCVGALFTFPLVFLIQAVAYLRMSGQPLVSVP